MPKTAGAKRDVLIALGCIVFLLVNLGAVGSGGRRRAKEAVCAANLKRWGVIFQTFANDNGGYFMNRSDAVGWVEDMLPTYYEDPRMLLCPEATRTFEQGGRNPFMAWPPSRDAGDPKGSYGINLWIADETDGRNSELFWRTPYVANTANVPILVDAQWKSMEPYEFDEPPVYEQDMWTPGPQNEMRRVCISRHNGGVSVVFLDGSVRKVGLKYLWRLNWYRGWDMDYPLPEWPAWMANFKDPQ